MKMKKLSAPDKETFRSWLRRRYTLNNIMLFTIVLVVIVFAVMITLMTNILFTKSIEREKDTNAENAKHFADRIESNFDHITRMVTLNKNGLSKIAVFTETEDELVENILVTLLELNPTVHRAWIVLEKGVRYADGRYIKEYVNKDGLIAENFKINDEDFNETDIAPWYYEPMVTGENYFNIAALHDCGAGDEFVHTAIISMPIISANGEIIGIFAVDIIYKDMFNTLQELDGNDHQDKSVTLLTRDMTVLHTVIQNMTMHNKDIDDFVFKHIDYMRDLIERDTEYSGEIVLPHLNKKVFLFLQPLSIKSMSARHALYLSTTVPLDSLYAAAYRIIFVFIILSFICIILIAGIIYASASMVLRPIRVLTQQAQKFSSGDLSTDVFGHSDPRDRSEIAHLKNALIKMLQMQIDNIRTVEQRVNDRTRELQVLNKYIKALMDSSSSYSLLADSETKIVYCSDSLMNFTDAAIDKKALINMPLSDAYKLIFKDENFTVGASHRLLRIMSGENEFSEEDSIVCPDGVKRLYQITYKRILNGTGRNEKTNGIIIVAHEITELRLKESKGRLRDILRTTALPCIVLDEKGDMVNYNRDAVRIFGNAVLSEGNISTFITENQPEFQIDGAEAESIRQKIIHEAAEKGFAQTNIQFRTNDGETLHFRVNVTRFAWLFGYRLIMYFYDTTEIVIKEAEAKANEQKMLEIAEREREARLQKETAQAANEAKSQFLANMSHEIRTPMNAVLGMSELLLQENMSKRQLRYVGDIRTSAMVLLDIINDILDVSKLQNGKLGLVPVHYNFNELIDHIGSIVHFLVEDKGISFKLVMPEQTPVCLYGDDIRLRQVLLNLLGNAVKFTSEGYVQLAVDFTDTSVQITVSDTGIGIPEENMDKLFEPFEQADRFKNRDKKGTGLGLTISKSIVEMMGGHITVESVYGKGTSFHVEIPKILGDTALMYQSDKKENMIYAPDAKILIVDDNVINLNVACGFLQLCGITAETATSGRQAVDMVRRNTYDIVFMDHMMPEMSGTEATKIIREMGINVTIIALTASVVVGAKGIMLEAGMNDYLAKPIIKEKLIHILQKWIPAEKLLEPPSKSAVPCEAESDADTDTDTDFWDKIEQIEEVSVSIGLKRVEGQRKVYKKTLKLITAEIDRIDQILTETEVLSGGGIDSLRIEAHSVKTSLANIGAMDLSAKAHELELAAKKKDADFCAVNLPDFLERLNRLNAKLKEAFALISQGGGTGKIPAELAPVFEKMINAFADADLVIIDKEMENLDAVNLNGALKEEAEKIKDMIMMMDYESATQLMRKIMRA